MKKTLLLFLMGLVGLGNLAQAATCAAYGPSGDLLNGAKTLDRQSGEQMSLNLGSRKHASILISAGLVQIELYREPTKKETDEALKKFGENISRVPLASVETRFGGAFSKASVQISDFNIVCE